MYQILHIFFLVFHASLVLFNLFGWLWKKTRLANLVTLGLTGASWTLLGIFYGWGYCPLTDWHYRVLAKLGSTDLPVSYMQYLAEDFFGLYLSQDTTDLFTLVFYLVALTLSLFYNIRQYSGRIIKN